jgi:3-oxoadipate enol-lactonase
MKIKANGVQLEYDTQGEGQWVVMSHSLACTGAMWDEQVQALKSKYKVLRFDTRGHGGSDAPAGAYDLDMLADDLHGLLSKLGVANPHFVGLSMGGMIGMTYALKYPRAFKSLVLCDTSSRIPPEAKPVWEERIKIAGEQGMGALVDSTLKRWFTEPYLAKGGKVIDRVATMIRNTPALGYIGCCHAIPQINVTDKARRDPMPGTGHRWRQRRRHAGRDGRSDPSRDPELRAGGDPGCVAFVEPGAADGVHWGVAEVFVARQLMPKSNTEAQRAQRTQRNSKTRRSSDKPFE